MRPATTDDCTLAYSEAAAARRRGLSTAEIRQHLEALMPDVFPEHWGFVSALVSRDVPQSPTYDELPVRCVGCED
ncbi:MAG: hypothetical protein JSR73_10675 [Proteobacteria bacterium]|nr:hypothetical protein [Pseudomonadota bacterium]